MDDQAKHRQLLEKLRQERDEIRLQLHLGKAELKEEWEALEKKWEHLEARMAEAAEGARETSREIGATFGVLSEELSEAYRRIRARLR